MTRPENDNSADMSDVDRIERTRMPLGEHLQQLRRLLIRIVIATFAGMILCMLFGGHIMSLLCIPLATALKFNGMPVTLRTLAPSESFVSYMNVCMAAGIFITSPYILYQLWHFVSIGMYDRERRVIMRYFPMSVGLFLAGALFFFIVIGPICLSFFIGFGRNFAPPAWTSPIMAKTPPPARMPAPPATTPATPATQETSPASPATPDSSTADDQVSNAPSASKQPLSLPVISGAPSEPADGDIWLDSGDNKVKLWLNGEPVVLMSPQKSTGGLVSPEITLGNYLSFIASLTLIFAAAFETPLVVLALTKMRLVTIETLRKCRRHAAVALLIVSAVVTPPDVFSQIALALPVYLLYEAGIILAVRNRRRTEAA